jgi:hypothetical protein
MSRLQAGAGLIVGKFIGAFGGAMNDVLLGPAPALAPAPGPTVTDTPYT